MRYILIQYYTFGTDTFQLNLLLRCFAHAAREHGAKVVGTRGHNNAMHVECSLLCAEYYVAQKPSGLQRLHALEQCVAVLGAFS